MSACHLTLTYESQAMRLQIFKAQIKQDVQESDCAVEMRSFAFVTKGKMN